MLQSADDAQRYADEGLTLFGEGWECVPSFDDLDEGEYEDEEEELYVTMDLGTTLDAKALQNETQYQLIGLDTPLPFLKIGNQIFQGEVTPLIGDEVILGLVRNHDNPQKPSHPPLHSTNKRLTFRAITLQPRTQPGQSQAQTQAQPRDSVLQPLSSVPPTTTMTKPNELMHNRSGIQDGASQDATAAVASMSDPVFEGSAEPAAVAVPASATTTTGNAGIPDDLDGQADVFISSSGVAGVSTATTGVGAATPTHTETSSANAVAGPSTQSSHQPFLAPLDQTPASASALELTPAPTGDASASTKNRISGENVTAYTNPEGGEEPKSNKKGTATTQSQPGKPKRKWTRTQRVVVNDREELERLDLDSMKPHQSIEIGPGALESLGLPPSVPGLGVSLNKRELVKLLSGLPERGVGSRGGKGAKAKAKQSTAGAAAAMKTAIATSQSAAGRQEDEEGGGPSASTAVIDGQDRSVAPEDQDHNILGQMTTGSAINTGGVTHPPAGAEEQKQDEDVQMIDVEDDPPWQEINDGDVPR
ncbi:hypothetical protein I317_00105 [Kwoniella heveanensis CBS 569]|nr:hypothetical protein I317_00105 [Kwoniella heveanensis CBS 569]